MNATLQACVLFEFKADALSTGAVQPAVRVAAPRCVPASMSRTLILMHMVAKIQSGLFDAPCCVIREVLFVLPYIDRPARYVSARPCVSAQAFSGH